MTTSKFQWFIVVLILITAITFRFKGLASTPPGLYPDEAVNGNDAIQALETRDFKVFYTENNGREGLFINLEAISIAFFGNQPWALRLVSAIAGVLTVLGLYLFTRKLFNWQIAAIAAFLLATSFWHTNFSRIGFRAILAPLIMVWSLYFLWRGLSSTKLWNFVVSGFIFSLGFYTYIAFRIMPLALILTLLVYWWKIKRDFGHEKYKELFMDISRGLAAFMVVGIIVALPIGIYFFNHPADFFGRTGQLSVFASNHMWTDLFNNTVKTLGMFNFEGDYNWRHNFSGSPLLPITVSIFFVIGIIRSIIKLIRTRQNHGHFAVTQTLTLSWFFIGLLPVILSNEGIPHALRAIIVVPVVYIFAAEGIWWIFNYFEDWEKIAHPIRSGNKFAAISALILLLSATAALGYREYFIEWAQNPNVAAAFNENYVEIGQKLNTIPASTPKYIYVKAGGILVDNIPMPAQTVMFITDTFTKAKQAEKNFHYVTSPPKNLPKNSVQFTLD